MASGSAVTRGLVVFCNAAAPHCLDSAVLAQAQLTSSGTAIAKLTLGPGTHSVKADFLGTKLLASSSSADEIVPVTGTRTSSISVSVSGSGPFTLTGTLRALGALAPTGLMSFEEASAGNALLASVPLSASQASHGFAGTQETGVNGPPQSVAFGDFNGDGIVDVATTTFFGQITVLLGNGDGTFRGGFSFMFGSNGANLSPVVIGDFNSDGIEDMAFTSNDPNTDANAVEILIGDGQGGFTIQSIPSLVTGTGVSDIAIGDFNGDGLPDLAIAELGTLSILLGVGDGTFSVQPVVPIGANFIASADFNGDGLTDLATANFDGTVTALTSNGDGTFTIKPPLMVESSPAAITTGDFNGDGRLDLATASGDTVSVLISNGDGTFAIKPATVLPLASGFSLYSIAAGDLNGDGITDLAVSLTSGGLGAVTVLFGAGDSSFTPVSTGLTSIGAFVAIGDFNADGVADLMSTVFRNGQATPLTVALTQLTSVASVTTPLAGGPHEIVALYSGDADYKPSQSQPLSFVVPTTPSPVFSPKPGTYAWTQHVALTDTTAGASIHYTLDGSAPTASSPTYTSPITVMWDARIKAIAVSPGLPASPEADGAYTIDRPLPAPVFSLPGGMHTSPQTLTMTIPSPNSCASTTCTIHYTYDGSTPTVHSAPYLHPLVFNVTGTATIKAIVTAPHFATSAVTSVTYTLTK